MKSLSSLQCLKHSWCTCPQWSAAAGSDVPSPRARGSVFSTLSRFGCLISHTRGKCYWLRLGRTTFLYRLRHGSATPATGFRSCRQQQAKTQLLWSGTLGRVSCAQWKVSSSRYAENSYRRNQNDSTCQSLEFCAHSKWYWIVVCLSGERTGLTFSVSGSCCLGWCSRCAMF